jgi:hypothetical protein
MATRLDIQVRNGTVSITVGGQSSSSGGDGSSTTGGDGKESGTATGGDGKESGTSTGGDGKESGTATGGGGNGGRGCCAPVVIGPIVISGGGLGTTSGSLGGDGKESGTQTGGDGKESGTQTGGDGKESGTATGGGGNGGGCCCAPLVIGPIVISGCCSGEASSSSGVSADPQGSQAVTVNPPASVTKTSPVTSQRNFTMEPQEQFYWCWAAVAVSVHNFLDPAPPTAFDGALTQGALATELLEEQGYPSPDCTVTPGSPVCNQPEALDVALTITQNLRQNGAMFNQHLTFDSIQNWISAQLPVCARIVWFGKGAGAHFIALDGCKVMSSGLQLVHVQDPDTSNQNQYGLWDYDALVEDYGPGGYWNDSYLVTA